MADLKKDNKQKRDSLELVEKKEVFFPVQKKDEAEPGQIEKQPPEKTTTGTIKKASKGIEQQAITTKTEEIKAEQGGGGVKAEQVKLEITKILDKNLAKFYNLLAPKQKEKLEQRKNKIISQIIYFLELENNKYGLAEKNKFSDRFKIFLGQIKDFLLVRNRANAKRHKIEQSVYRLLTNIPGQNKYYLRQQAKIIVDDIVKL